MENEYLDRISDSEALDHAWRWFELLAKQRMEMLNYFIVSIAFLAAAYGAGIQADRPFLSFVVAILGIVVVVCFRGIEARTRELVKVSEVALADMEHKLSDSTGVESLEIVMRSERKGPGVKSYRVIIRDLQTSVLVAFILGAAFGVYLSV